MSASVEELAALRAEVNALKATRLTPEQLAARCAPRSTR